MRNYKRSKKRTKDKDIIQICKFFLFYEKEYKDELEALKAYQAKRIGRKSEEVSDFDILNYDLINLGKIYFKPNNWTSIARKITYDISKDNVNINHNYLCWLYIKEIQNLQVANGQKWIVDISDYGKETVI